MRTISLPAGGLTVMSGIPGSGKSFLLEQSRLAPGIVQSTDRLREVLGGRSLFYGPDGSRVLEPMEAVGSIVWKTLYATVEDRLKQGLTTIVDATLVADYTSLVAEDILDCTGRAVFADLAARYNAPFKVLIMDTPVDVARERNRSRQAQVSEESMSRFINGRPTLVPGHKEPQTIGAFDRTSQFPFEMVSSSDRIQIVAPIQLQDDNWDVVGDVHGMLEPLKQFLGSLGYVPTADGLVEHPEGRRLLFLGDIVDRGPHSLEALDFVMRMVQSGCAQCVMGNHEDKLVRFWDRLQDGRMDEWTSYANAQSGMDLTKLPKAKAVQLIHFMRSLPLFACFQNDSTRVFFAHADARSIHVQSSVREDLLFGRSDWGRVDTDLAMQLFLENEDAFITPGAVSIKPTRTQFYIRGHIPNTSQQKNVLSLDDRAYANGTLRVLRLDAFIRGEEALHVFDTHYDYTPVQESRVAPYKELKALVEQSLATASVDKASGLRLFKYAKKVFYEASWSKSEALSRARGHVYDIAGNIVSNPFDKVFNYKEEGAGIDLTDETPVLAVEKLNGFLGIISPHPVKLGEVLIHTTGSFSSDYVGYVKDLLAPATRGRMVQFFESRPLTMMFEVIHPKDPHVIAYDSSFHGLHLIGAREIKVGSQLLSEIELDSLAKLINVRRPAHFKTTFGELQALNHGCKHEGYMVRAMDSEESMILKLKSPYYLTTKFLSRMKDGNWKHMFANPESFKQRLDEEFFPLVDLLQQHYKLESILMQDEFGRRDLVQDLIHEMLQPEDVEEPRRLEMMRM